MADDEQAPPPDPADALVDASGQPLARRARGKQPCPQCGAGPARRRLSGGFGHPTDICGACGHDYQERTL